VSGLCLFDLDDTLLPIDSDHAWGEFMVRLGWVDEQGFRRANDAWFAAYRDGSLDIHAYIAFATEPLRLRSAAEIAAAQGRFMREVIGPAIEPQASALVDEHRRRGDRMALVTATHEIVTAPIADAFGFGPEDLIAIRVQRGAGATITGRIDGTPSFSAGKVVRVEEWLAKAGRSWADHDRISVYSDSVNDLPLLERATDPVATNPSPTLEAIARERGWRILKLFA